MVYSLILHPPSILYWAFCQSLAIAFSHFLLSNTPWRRLGLGFSVLVQRSRMNFPSAPIKGALLPNGPSEWGTWADRFKRGSDMESSAHGPSHKNPKGFQNKGNCSSSLCFAKKKRKTKILRWLSDMFFLSRALFWVLDLYIHLFV